MMDWAELQKVLEAHERWLTWKHREGRAELAGADLEGAPLRKRDLRKVEMCEANLRGADLMGADLGFADLSGADLREADLSGADLREADLMGADLGFADLSRADLRGANLRNADLSRADLRGANLRNADLSRADLWEADLRGTDLRSANINGTDLSGAYGVLSPIEFLKENFETWEEGYVAYKTFGERYAVPRRWDIKPGSVIAEVVNPDRGRLCGCGINVATLEWVRANNCSGGDIWRMLIRWEWLPGVVVPYDTGGEFRCERAELVEIVEASGRAGEE